MEEEQQRLPRRPDAPRIVAIPSPLPSEWDGWTIKGNYLVTPTGEKIHRRRVEGMAFREHLELRRAGYASRRAAEAAKRGRQYGAKVKVVIVDLHEYLANGLAAG